jgi:DNA-binding transcriptional MerR regulator
MEVQRIYIGEAASRLGVTPRYIRLLEAQGSIPRAQRDALGRTYTETDLALLRCLGIGSRPRKLRRAEDVLGVVR